MARRAWAAAGFGLALVIAVPTASAAVDRSAPPGGGAALPLPYDPGAARAAGQTAGPEQPNLVAPRRPSTSPAPSSAAPSATVTYRVYATQYVPGTPGSVEVAVPDKCAKFAALGLVDQSCPAGYQRGLDYRVTVQRASGQQAAIPVKDVGPWNIDDNYWDPVAGPRPRRLFTDLPQGTPEAQAAFYNGYNTVSNCNTPSGQPSGHAGPADQFGRCVLNPAGIDLSVAAAATLGLGSGQSEWVTVSFLWESSPSPPPNCTTYTSPNTGSHQVCGAIRDKYLALGGPGSFLGYPTTDELPTPDGIGRFNHFANAGSIYWTPSTGAWAIHGAIRAKWASMGWERSVLGYPTTDELPTPDGIGRFNHFSNGGSIYWTPGTGAWEIHGAIRAKWSSLGWERSFLGYPVTDETGTPDGIGRFNHFSSTGNGGNVDGSVYWTPATGAWSIHGAIRAKWSSLGWERSCLGYPVSDEFGIPGGRQSDLQRGLITYSFSSAQATSSC